MSIAHDRGAPGNEIGEAGLASILRALDGNCTLTSLVLGGEGGGSGLRACSWALVGVLPKCSSFRS